MTTYWTMFDTALVLLIISPWIVLIWAFYRHE